VIRTISRVTDRKDTVTSMPVNRRPVANVLLTCALDEGIGGVQVVLRNLVRGLEQSGRHVYFVYDAPLSDVRLREGINTLGCPAFYCPMPAFVRNSALLSVPVFCFYLPIAVFQLARVIRGKKIDVINCHFLTVYFLHIVIAARLLRVPIVISVHGADIDAYSELSLLQKFIHRQIMRGADRIVACSAAMARRTAQVFPNVGGKVTFVHNGLDLSDYLDGHTTRALPKPYILCVCRHVQKKGIDTLLRAFALVQPECPAMSLVLVGDGPLFEAHKELARTLQIDDRVVFVGSTAHAEVASFFQGCTLFVLPSRSEPFGLVILEAAYYRKGIVSTGVGGVPEIVTNGVNGLLVEPDDPKGMAKAIVALVEDPTRRDQLGAQAHETLLKRFLWKDRIDDYLAVYEGRPNVFQQPGPADSSGTAVVPAKGTRTASSAVK
jgi:glycosyltransferase involved in cell wall biosynthesis